MPSDNKSWSNLMITTSLWTVSKQSSQKSWIKNPELSSNWLTYSTLERRCKRVKHLELWVRTSLINLGGVFFVVNSSL